MTNECHIVTASIFLPTIFDNKKIQLILDSSMSVP